MPDRERGRGRGRRCSKALPLLILGFIKIRKGRPKQAGRQAGRHVGILDFLPLYAAEGFGLAGFKGREREVR